MGVWDCYLRWRHSKGFGVHSPYAFRLINDVLKPGPYGYYAYHKAERLAMKGGLDSGMAFKELKFIIRLAVFLNSTSINICGHSSKAAEYAARSLNLPYRTIHGKIPEELKSGDLVIIEGDGINENDLKELIGKGVSVLAYSPTENIRAILTAPLEKGLLFIGKTKLLLIPRQEMSYLSYLMRF